MSLKRFVLVLIILLILTLSTAIAETYYPDTYGEGETQHIWAKFKQVNGHIISTDTQTRCDLKNDSTTDGQKDCTSEFIIKILMVQHYYQVLILTLISQMKKI